MEQWVFAYGSNMDVGDLREWLRRASHTDNVLEVAKAELHDHQLIWNYFSRTRGAGAANVERQPGSIVFGVALRVDDPTLLGIDAKEGHPRFYKRDVAMLQANGSSLSAWLYVALPERCSKEPVWPCRSYLRTIVDAARAHGLDAKYIAELERTPTID